MVFECRSYSAALSYAFASGITAVEKVLSFPAPMLCNSCFLMNFCNERLQNPEDVRLDSLVFCHFAGGLGDSEYCRVKQFETLKALIKEALDSYNDMNAAMNLVLFEDAILHMLVRVNKRRLTVCQSHQ